jgi:antitoxin HicB
VSDRYTVILVPTADGIAASVPAMPGCVSQGATPEEAISNAREAMTGWVMTEGEQNRGPLRESSEVISLGVAEALDIIREMREGGEMSPDSGFELELRTVDLRPAAV